MRLVYSCLFIVGFLIALGASNAQSSQPKPYIPVTTVPTDLQLVEVGKVKDVLRSNQIQLENGEVFILDNIRVPLPYEQMARDELTSLVKGKTIGLYSNPTLPQEGQADDHGNEIVHAILEDGTWVQQDLVAKGLAWVDTSPVHRDLVNTLYKYEIPARAKHLGFWAAPEYQVHNTENMGRTIGTFVLFEGKIASVRRAGVDWDFLYFNHPAGVHVSKNGHEGFLRPMTIALKTANETMFKSFAVDAARHSFSVNDMINTRVRIRGWVNSLPVDGTPTPMIELTNPEQIEYPDGPPVVK